MDRHIRTLERSMIVDGDIDAIMAYHRACIRNSTALVDPVRIRAADMDVEGDEPERIRNLQKMRWPNCICYLRNLFPHRMYPESFKCATDKGNEHVQGGEHIQWQWDVEGRAGLITMMRGDVDHV